jgi:intracellular septation protein
MKFLFDLFPVVLFFIAFKFFGIYAATAIAIAASLAQVLYLKVRRRPVGIMNWLSLAIVAIFGGATLVLHDETFIKWKPTVLYWLFALTLIAGELGFRKNFIRALLEPQQVALPDVAWKKLNWSWIAFFGCMGLLNLYVAYHFSTDTWVNFKLFGGMGLMLLFVVLQAVFLARYAHVKDSPRERP